MPSKILVYLDVVIGNRAGGRVVFELFNDVAPMAVENFRGLCTGEYGNAKASGLPLSFKGCKFFRVVPGFIVQSGDFDCNNGDGGESIYGGTFKDESFLRRHAQAGVLSMANKGRHSNGSQFFVTLKRAPQLDGKHVAIGQVIQGIEVIRAMEKCPIDSSNTPRIPILIVACGQLDKAPGVRRTGTTEMRDAVETLMATLGGNDQRMPVSSSSQSGIVAFDEALDEVKTGRVKRVEKQRSDEENRAMSQSVEQSSRRERTEDTEEFLDLKDERQKKLYELRLRMNQGRRMNAKEVAQEAEEPGQCSNLIVVKKRMKEALTDLDQSILNRKEVEEEEEEEENMSDGRKPKEKRDKQSLYLDKKYLNETADAIQWKDDRKKKKLSNVEKSFGWNAFNVDSHYRAHKKRTRDLELNNQEYASQMLHFGDHFYDPTAALVSAEFKPTEEAKDRLAQEVERQKAKRKTFSRRRMHVEDEDVGYINEFNRRFNKQLEKAYGAHSLEIRQNLERGTAL